MYDVHAFFRTPLVLYIARPPPDRFTRPRRPCSCSSLGLEVRLRKRIRIRLGSRRSRRAAAWRGSRCGNLEGTLGPANVPNAPGFRAMTTLRLSRLARRAGLRLADVELKH
jgi:hypothetical protein